MRPPSDEALQRAATILTESTEAENVGDAITSDGPEAAAKRQLEILETAAIAIRKKLLIDAATVKRRHNYDVVPIFTLPPEVLAEVFVHDIYLRTPGRKFKREKQHTRHHVLAQVCSLWRDVILQTPRLWADIRCEMEEGALAWRKSREHPLHISYCPMGHDTPDARTQEFLENLRSHWSRVRSLKSTISGPQVDTLVGLLRKPAPSLWTLRLSFYLPTFVTNVAIIELPPPTLQSLRRLDLQNVTLQWDQLQLPHLRTLALRKIHRPPTEAQLLAILKGAPDLESLILDEFPPRIVNPVDRPTVRHKGGDPIVLPNLRTLFLRKMGVTAVDRLISNLQAPSLRGLSLYNVHPDQLDTSGPDAHIYNMAKEIASSAGAIEIKYSTYKVTIKKKRVDNGRYLHLALPSHDPNAIMDVVIKFVQAILPTSAKLELVVDCALEHHDELDESFEPACLSSMGNLNKLTITHSVECANSVLRHLQQPLPGGEEGWPCPNLRHIDLSQVSPLNLGVVSEFEANRYGAGVADESSRITWTLPKKETYGDEEEDYEPKPLYAE